MDIKQINTAIMLGTWTNVELSSMIDAVKWNRAQLGNQLKRAFTVGSAVKFTLKSGIVMTGTVNSIAIKNVSVNTSGGRYKVPASMLEAA